MALTELMIILHYLTKFFFCDHQACMGCTDMHESKTLSHNT